MILAYITIKIVEQVVDLMLLVNQKEGSSSEAGGNGRMKKRDGVGILDAQDRGTRLE